MLTKSLHLEDLVIYDAQRLPFLEIFIKEEGHRYPGVSEAKMRSCASRLAITELMKEKEHLLYVHVLQKLLRKMKSNRMSPCEREVNFCAAFESELTRLENELLEIKAFRENYFIYSNRLISEQYKSKLERFIHTRWETDCKAFYFEAGLICELQTEEGIAKFMRWAHSVKLYEDITSKQVVFYTINDVSSALVSINKKISKEDILQYQVAEYLLSFALKIMESNTYGGNGIHVGFKDYIKYLDFRANSTNPEELQALIDSVKS